MTSHRFVTRGLAIFAVWVAIVCVGGGCRVTPWVPAPEIQYDHAAVACDHQLASEAGVEMLRQGGNAVDAAVAASFTLSVVRPYSCGIGGGGFMIIAIPQDDQHSETEFVAINYRETAPAAVGPDYFRKFPDDTASRFGIHAVGVPGTVAGLLYALGNYGTLDRATVLNPAISAAENGFIVDENYITAVEKISELGESHPQFMDLADQVIHEFGGGGNLTSGQALKLPHQAKALRLIAEKGTSAFYEGEIAQAIVNVMRNQGGAITRDDLLHYRVQEEDPLVGNFLGKQVVTMSPPSSGGVAMLQILGMLQRKMPDLRYQYHNTAGYVHLITEAMKYAFADRATWLADPDYVDVPVDDLLDTQYLDQRALGISGLRTHDDPSAYISPLDSDYSFIEDGGTSHISVIDAHGMAVACTETINLTFGSLVVVPGFGFVLNDQMDDFTTVPGSSNAFGLQQSDRNLPEPGKRPLSSMSPTIVLENNRVIYVAGASGGPRIISGTLQCLLNCMLFNMTAADAVNRSRFHHQWLPNKLWLEESWPSWTERSKLRLFEHDLATRREIGVVQLLAVIDNQIHAASDPRKGGMPAGY